MGSTLARRVRDAIGTAIDAPPIRALRARRYARNFGGDWPGAFCGVFASFDEAERAAPRTRPLGYDHAELAAMYRDRMRGPQSSDWPVMFWLSRALETGRRVFDWGGHVGVTFYALERHLRWPPDLSWVVCDVPAIVAEGARLAAERARPSLSFTTRFEDAEGVDVFLACGSLQYVDGPSLGARVARLARPPRHLIVSKLPLWDGEPFVTLQNTGPAIHAYRIFNRASFVGDVERAGYRLVDAWDSPEHACRIPFHASHTVSAYSGLFFERTA